MNLTTREAESTTKLCSYAFFPDFEQMLGQGSSFKRASRSLAKTGFSGHSFCVVKTDVFATFAPIKVPWKILVTFRAPREQKGRQNGAQREPKRDQMGAQWGQYGARGGQKGPKGAPMGPTGARGCKNGARGDQYRAKRSQMEPTVADFWGG